MLPDVMRVHVRIRVCGFVLSMRNCLSPSSSFPHSADTSQPYFTVDLAYTRSLFPALCPALSPALVPVHALALSPASPSNRCRPAAREQPLRDPLGSGERRLCVVCACASYTTWVRQMLMSGQRRDSSTGERDVGLT